MRCKANPRPRAPLLDTTTGLFNLCGRTAMQVPPVKAMPTMDSLRMPKEKGALPSETGSEHSVDPQLLERFRVPENNRGCHREVPPLRQTKPATIEVDTATNEKNEGEKKGRPFQVRKREAPRNAIRARRPLDCRGAYRGGSPFISSVIAAPGPFALWLPPRQDGPPHRRRPIGRRGQ